MAPYKSAYCYYLKSGSNKPPRTSNYHIQVLSTTKSWHNTVLLSLRLHNCSIICWWLSASLKFLSRYPKAQNPNKTSPESASALASVRYTLKPYTILVAPLIISVLQIILCFYQCHKPSHRTRQIITADMFSNRLYLDKCQQMCSYEKYQAVLLNLKTTSFFQSI